MVNEVGREITNHQRDNSLLSASVNVFHITAPPTRLRSTNLIDLWTACCIVLIVRNLEIKARLGQIDGLTENPWTYIPHPPNTSFLSILLFFTFGKNKRKEKIGN